MVNAIELLGHRRDELSSTSVEALDLLADEVQKFQQLVVDLLEISRPETGVDILAAEALDLTVLVENVARRDRSNPPVDGFGTPPIVLGDRRRLVRVVANVLDNAQRHGGGATRIAVGSRNGRARIEVDDRGPGVARSDGSLIFGRFARGQHVGGRNDGGGSGLGLALVAQHLRAHQGSTWVEPGPGGGARFIIELPEIPPSTAGNAR